MEDTRRVILNGKLTASQVEEAIRALAEMRAGMQPEVLATPPDGSTELTLLHEPLSLFKVGALIGGGLRLYIRSTGLGWMAFDLPRDYARTLGNALLHPPELPPTH